MQAFALALATLSFLSILSPSPASAASGKDALLVERGKYLAQVAGCNDCHTPGYMQNEGKVPENLWLTGADVGFQGPWGTSYPVNLRLYLNKMSEAQWIARARQPMRPPMPWYNLREMSDKDLLALYRYVRFLGPAGDPAPVAVAPGQPVATPYVEFVPKNLPLDKQASR
ncbi:MAG: cytochrome c [Candidatus Accumulibacter phosphatis]|uniref:Cytochrome n=1 Tax=Candidatus Accumulibacter phosphatis TaxID=327160 RepID=A0A5S4EHG6_9PROT|nr:c-type cytochrome [Candidatus Accumulibacter phosphatis]MCQ1547503.1 cytochrome c [Candidatus Accumulibacter phosphatis]TMQ74721.1 Cytochrome [Candidatus Accumulibacter phosphatis]